jgi:hypothetical protein
MAFSFKTMAALSVAMFAANISFAVQDTFIPSSQGSV